MINLNLIFQITQVNDDLDVEQYPNISEEDEEETPLDLRWPKGWKRRINYILLAPILYFLFIVLPDPRRPVRFIYKYNNV